MVAVCGLLIVSPSAGLAQNGKTPGRATKPRPKNVKTAKKPRPIRGWNRVRRGVWTFAIDHGRVPDVGLGLAPQNPTGRGILLVQLPPGTQSAKLAAIEVAYVRQGKLTWSVVSKGKRVAVKNYEATNKTVGPLFSSPVWTRHAMGNAPLGKSFRLIFSAPNQLAQVGSSKGGFTPMYLFYALRPRGRVSPVLGLPFIRIHLTGVVGAEKAPTIPPRKLAPRCRDRAVCKRFGLCKNARGTCVVGRHTDCRRSLMCKDLARCFAGRVNCIVRSSKDCRRSKLCSHAGKCTYRYKQCTQTSATDCARSARCRLAGECALGGWGCQPRHDRHCKASTGCKTRGKCAVRGRVCK